MLDATLAIAAASPPLAAVSAVLHADSVAGWLPILSRGP